MKKLVFIPLLLLACIPLKQSIHDHFTPPQDVYAIISEAANGAQDCYVTKQGFGVLALGGECPKLEDVEAVTERTAKFLHTSSDVFEPLTLIYVHENMKCGDEPVAVGCTIGPPMTVVVRVTGDESHILAHELYHVFQYNTTGDSDPFHLNYGITWDALTGRHVEQGNHNARILHDEDKPWGL